jgi:very-short-patch-repair endonuclease
MLYPDEYDDSAISGVRFKPFSMCLREALDSASIAHSFEAQCDSYIEIELGIKLAKALRVTGDAFVLKPQFPLGRYLYDWAILRKEHQHPVILVECDGKEFHSTPEQMENDARKDKLARSKRIFLRRFAGSEIHRAPDHCVAKILMTMWYQGHLRQRECDLLDEARIKRVCPLF